MKKHVDLCVELRKGKYVRDGLIQYRAICQQVNVGSLEMIIAHFLESCEKRAKEAQGQSEDVATVLLQTLDLDEPGEQLEDAPETIVMRAVSGESTKDRTDREILAPWLKFLWESYRTALDVTRTNTCLEGIYHDTAKKAFSFCQRYQRKVEFRRLCELIRLHHPQKNKYFDAAQRAKLMASQESFNLYIETRFRQLQVATNLDLWQEAYKSIEDIHGNITFFKKSPPAKQMIEYFDKLMRVFWVARNYLFHAYACLKYFNLYHPAVRTAPPSKKDPSADDICMAASKVVLSALCVPFWDRKNSHRHKDELFVYNISREKDLRIINLLGSPTIPTRASLLQDLANRRVMDATYPELRPLYSLLEAKFDPLGLCHALQPVAAFLRTHPALEPYVEPLQRVAAVRMVEQVCRVYDTMRIPELCKLCPYYSFVELERLFVEVAKQGYPGIFLVINHHQDTVTFANNQTTCDSLAGQLSQMTRKLEPLVAQCTSTQRLGHGFRGFVAGEPLIARLAEERAAVLERKRVIEERKELQEQREREQGREEEAQQARNQELLMKNEMGRIQTEAAEREAQRQRQAQQQEQEAKNRILLDQLKSQNPARQKYGASKFDESLIKDHDRLYEEARKAIVTQRQEKEKKLIEEARRMDHFERACRDEERPLLQKLWEQQNEEARLAMQQNFETDLAEHRRRWESAISEKRRLERMADRWEEFRAAKLQERELQRAQEQEAADAAKQRIRAMQEEQDREDAERLAQRENDEEEEEEDEEEAEAAPQPERRAPPPEERRAPAPTAPSPAQAAGSWRSGNRASPAASAAPAAAPTPAAAPAAPAAAPTKGAYVPPSKRKQ